MPRMERDIKKLKKYRRKVEKYKELAEDARNERDKITEKYAKKKMGRYVGRCVDVFSINAKYCGKPGLVFLYRATKIGFAKTSADAVGYVHSVSRSGRVRVDMIDNAIIERRRIVEECNPAYTSIMQKIKIPRNKSSWRISSKRCFINPESFEVWGVQEAEYHNDIRIAEIVSSNWRGFTDTYKTKAYMPYYQPASDGSDSNYYVFYNHYSFSD